MKYTYTIEKAKSLTYHVVNGYWFNSKPEADIYIKLNELHDLYLAEGCPSPAERILAEINNVTLWAVTVTT